MIINYNIHMNIIKYNNKIYETEIKRVNSSIPDVLYDIIFNYIKDECNNCNRLVYVLFDKTIKLYKYIPKKEENTWRTIYPDFFKDYRLCEQCITNNICSLCENIFKNKISHTYQGKLLCVKCLSTKFSDNILDF